MGMAGDGDNDEGGVARLHEGAGRPLAGVLPHPLRLQLQGRVSSIFWLADRRRLPMASGVGVSG